MSSLKLTSYVVSIDPKISVIPNFLTSDECMHFIKISENIGFQRSLVGRGSYAADSEDQSENLDNVYSENRTSGSVTLEPFMDNITTGVEARLAALVNLPLDQLEQLVVVKYKPGEFFKSHSDGVFRPYTVFLYLNDVPSDEGGETRFPQLGLRIRPSAGTAVVWKNSSKDALTGQVVEDARLMHEGLPTSGDSVKYGINCFFNYQIMRQSRNG